MKVAVLQSNYVPWKGYFDLIDYVDTFILYDCVQYTKNDWRNRNRILIQGNLFWLTIPVNNTSLTQKINETQVASPKWAKKHWTTVQQSYAGRPGFKAHAAWLGKLYGLASELPLLTEINETFIRAVSDHLGITTEILRSDHFDLDGDRNDRILQLCDYVGAKTYVSGPAAQAYLAQAEFKRRGVNVEWFEYAAYPKYPQQSEPFIHEVSVLDLLLNCGENARNVFSSRKPRRKADQ